MECMSSDQEKVMYIFFQLANRYPRVNTLEFDAV